MAKHSSTRGAVTYILRVIALPLVLFRELRQKRRHHHRRKCSAHSAKKFELNIGLGTELCMLTVDFIRFGREATEKFGEVFTPGFTKHVFLNTEVLRSPVTEVMLAFFPSKVTTDAQTTVSQRFSEFNHKALKQCKDVRSVSSGWGLEADFPIRGDGNNGGKGMLFIALIGWGSVNEHNAFRESDVFKEYVGLITGMEECLDLSMFHLRCEVLERQGDN